MPAADDRQGLPLRLRVLIATAAALGAPAVAIAAAGIALGGAPTATLLGAAVFLLMAFLADLKPVPLKKEGDRPISLAFVFILSSQFLFGWEYAVVIAAISVLVPQLIERRPLSRILFNTGVYAAAAVASSLPTLLGGGIDHRDSIVVAGWTFVAGLAFVAVNFVGVCLAVSFATAQPFRPLLVDNVRHGGPAFLTMTFLSSLAVVLWTVDPPLLALLAGPLAALTLYQRSALASQIAHRDAHTDSLTGLGNHRAYELAMAAAVDADAEGGNLLTLCFLDIDDFKQVNDTFGHPAGDAALERLGALLRDLAGGSAYRFGGDEFAVVLPGGERVAAEAIENLLARVAETDVGAAGRLRVSVGACVFPDEASTLDQLEQKADAALYWAKRHGKAAYRFFDDTIDLDVNPEELAHTTSRNARLQAAEQFIRVVDARDTYTGEHSQSVARLAEGIARKLGLDEDTVRQVRLAALLHDLGKIGLPDELLRKPGPLTTQERLLMRTHPELGCALLDGLELDPVDTWILHHHENWDGSGYPLGLAGEEIPLGSRIILVADAFDAMVTERSYSSARSVGAALLELRRMTSRQFDPAVVAALEAHLGLAGHLGLEIVGPSDTAIEIGRVA